MSDNYVALEAKLDRMAASARDHGEKIEITEFEAVVLATLADIGAVALLTNWRDMKERGKSMRVLDKARPVLRSMDLDPNDIAVNGAAIVRVGRLAEYNALAPDAEGSEA